jgi:hypothetical protein
MRQFKDVCLALSRRAVAGYERAPTGHRNSAVAGQPRGLWRDVRADRGRPFSHRAVGGCHQGRGGDGADSHDRRAHRHPIVAPIRRLDAFMVAGGGVLAWMGFSMLSAAARTFEQRRALIWTRAAALGRIHADDLCLVHEAAARRLNDNAMALVLLALLALSTFVARRAVRLIRLKAAYECVVGPSTLGQTMLLLPPYCSRLEDRQ